MPPSPTPTSAPPVLDQAAIDAANRSAALSAYQLSGGYAGASGQSRAYQDLQHQQQAAGLSMQQAGQAYLRQRDPYYAALQKSVYNSQAPVVQQHYADAIKAQSLAAAERGLQGGSEDQYQKGRLATQKQVGLQQATISGQQAAQQAQMQDQAAVNEWLKFTQSEGAATLRQYAGGAQASVEAQRQATANQQFMQSEIEKARMQNAIQQSQMYGGMLDSASKGIPGIVQLFMGNGSGGGD